MLLFLENEFFQSRSLSKYFIIIISGGEKMCVYFVAAFRRCALQIVHNIPKHYTITLDQRRTPNDEQKNQLILFLAYSTLRPPTIKLI